MLQSIRAWVEWIDAQPSSAAIRESLNGYPALLTFHVITMCIFAGLILMMDLRLLGVGNRRTPFSEIQRSLFPAQMTMAALAMISGLALAYGQPTRFYDNIFFWLKMLMILLTGANAAIFHYTTYESIREWDSARVPPMGAKFAALVSIVLWVAVIASGRLIAYNWFSFT
jgi:hypothetical protein